MPFFDRLDASVAGRWFDYSTSGNGDTYKAGLSWRPVHELLFRGSYGEGFRSPSIGELYGSASRFDQEVVDPCSGFSAATPANVRANCIAPRRSGQWQLHPAEPAGRRHHQRQPQPEARDIQELELLRRLGAVLPEGRQLG
jgi:iron complex outermembrane receptor protein